MKQQLESPRQLRALDIVENGNQIKRINKDTYRVKSQSDPSKNYLVTRLYGKASQGIWECECPDHQIRKVVCKHIYAVRFSKLLRKKITSEPIEPIEIPTEPSVCERCGSDKIIKHGLRHNQSGIVQRYKCKECEHKFIINYGFEKAKASPKVITASLDLYFKGISLRKVTDHLRQFYGVNISHVAILGWIRKFVKVVKPYVESLTPSQLSGIWHVDEMMINVRKEEMGKGHYAWLWNLMDDTTRFWISSKISQRRELNDARVVFQDAKNKADMPKVIIHDGLPAYHKAYNKEFYTNKKTRPLEIRSISVRREGKNSLIERMQGSVRDREKVMRGLDNKESAQEIADAIRINYNFVRPHQSLKGKTPAEVAGVNLQLGNNKIDGLIRQGAIHKRKNKAE